MDARYPMDELNEELQLGLEESSDYDSVGGYVYATLGEIPEAGTTFEVGRLRWTVDRVNGHRVERVILRSQDPWPTEVLAAHRMDSRRREPGIAQRSGDAGMEGNLSY